MSVEPLFEVEVGELLEVEFGGLLEGPVEPVEKPSQLFWGHIYGSLYIFYFYISPSFAIFYTVSGDSR